MKLSKPATKTQKYMIVSMNMIDLLGSFGECPGTFGECSEGGFTTCTGEYDSCNGAFQSC